MAGSSSSNAGYPSYVCAPNSVTMKLSGRETYDVWKIQMLCLLESHDMLHFVVPAENGSVLGEENNSKLWKRSDAVVKGWILGSLSQQPLEVVVNLVKTNTSFTSKDVWDKLHTIYGPALPIQKAAAEVVRETRTETAQEKTERKEKEREIIRLHAATLNQSFWGVKHILSRAVVTLRDKITTNGNTVLHVAVGTTRNRGFLRQMLNLATPPLDMLNSEGSSLLHVAAIVGNTEAAKLLVKKDRDLLFAMDNEGQTPLARALLNMHTDTYVYLLHYSKASDDDIEAGNRIGWRLLVNLVSSKDYPSAVGFFSESMSLTNIDPVLMAVAQNFPSEPNSWERMLAESTCSMTFSGYVFTTLPWFIEAMRSKRMVYRHAKILLHKICVFIKSNTESETHHEYYNNAILEATRQNADDFVQIVVSEFPNAIFSTNEHGHNIIQYAVITRSEKVYNLLYQMSEHKNKYKTIKDPFGNNLLHLAARLAPPDKLNDISGAALQIQRELQWFKEVQGFVSPLNIIQKNSSGETPQMVFTREHKELVIEGEKWMKETAHSYTITAALITTIVFAAAITVPGGNKQDNGIPEFTSKSAFTVFAISDAISLFTSATSLLMFLSILTTRFSEKDFLFKLPTKLMIGLTSLFISTTAMLVAFGATLYLMFCQNNPRILVPVAALTCLPIACFVMLQFPLIKDLMTSTYGHSIFGRKSNNPFY